MPPALGQQLLDLDLADGDRQRELRPRSPQLGMS
jgi:hypothetical protein